MWNASNLSDLSSSALTDHTSLAYAAWITFHENAFAFSALAWVQNRVPVALYDCPDINFANIE